MVYPMRVPAPTAARFVWLAWLVLLVVQLASPNVSRADPFHYQTLPLGQRALGMGGAFTGLANDPSAAYYNPAGLAWISDSALSASLTVNAFDRRTVDRGYRTRIGSRSLEHESEPSLPVFVTLVKKIGRKHPDLKRRHAVALSTFLVDQRKLNFDVELRGQSNGEDIADTFSADREESTIWHGLSYAYRLSERLSLGMSGFLSTTRVRYGQEHISVALGALDRSTGSYESRTSLWETYRARHEVRNLVMRFGVLYETEDDVRLGLMLQPPSIHVKGEANVRARKLTSDIVGMPPSGLFTNASESGLPAHSPIPWELRLGASYKPLDWVTVAMDGSLYGKNGSKSSPVVAIGARSADPDTGAVPEAGAFALETWYREMTANVSMGAEAVIENTVAIRGGLFTSLSAAPDVPRASDTYSSADINLYGGALSVGYVASGYDLSLGMAWLFGFGDALAYNVDATGDDVYQRTDVYDRTLFIFLSGAKSAVSKLASTADKKLQQLRRESEAEAAREARKARQR